MVCQTFQSTQAEQLNEVVGGGEEHLFGPQGFYAAFHPSYSGNDIDHFIAASEYKIILSMPEL